MIGEDESLTGRIRHRCLQRVIRRNLVILQVEVTYTPHWYGDERDKSCTYWRDAQPDDLMCNPGRLYVHGSGEVLQ